MALRAVIWTALGLSLGYHAHSEEVIRGLPCIQRLHQLYCRHQGNDYPNDRIENFIEMNKALTRRMFGEFQAEEVSFPNIQEFRTINFPEHLRPKEVLEFTAAFGSPRPPRRRSRERFEARRRAARARASSARKANAASNNGERRVMTSVQPTPVVTRTPLKNTATRPPFAEARPPFAGNVFLSGGEELIAAASQPAARYPRRDHAATNQPAGPQSQRVRRSEPPYNATSEEGVSPGRRRRQTSRRFGGISRQGVPAPPSINKGSKHLVDSCESKIEITTPYWAANSAGEIRAIVNTKHFPQAIHQEICKGTKTSRCSGDCACEQKYTYHRLLAYDPDNDCRGIFIDWFLFPSCCACRCPP